MKKERKLVMRKKKKICFRSDLNIQTHFLLVNFVYFVKFVFDL